jgi:hypothetical protein
MISVKVFVFISLLTASLGLPVEQKDLADQF